MINSRIRFVGFETLIDEIMYTEPGILSQISADFLSQIGSKHTKNFLITNDLYVKQKGLPAFDPHHIVIDSDDECIKDRYFLSYPFKQCFLGSVASFSSDNLVNLKKSMEWLSANRVTMQADSEIPIFISDYSFENFFESRLRMLFHTSISRSQYKEFASNPSKYAAIVTSDRNQYVMIHGDARHKDWGSHRPVLTFLPTVRSDEHGFALYDFDTDHILNFSERLFLVTDLAAWVPQEMPDYGYQIRTFFKNGDLSIDELGLSKVVLDPSFKWFSMGETLLGDESNGMVACEFKALTLLARDINRRVDMQSAYYNHHPDDIPMFTPFEWSEY